ncbi:unnamed protein product, partial [Musa textilis]
PPWRANSPSSFWWTKPRGRSCLEKPARKRRASFWGCSRCRWPMSPSSLPRIARWDPSETSIAGVEELDVSYLQREHSTSHILGPTPPASPSPDALLLLPGPSSSPKRHRRRDFNSYVCGNDVADVEGAICLACTGTMTREMEYAESDMNRGGGADGGFVKGVVTYTTMDDL